MPRRSTRAVNRVQSGYIRTEADEVHYNLHIMMRFDLERALIRGDCRWPIWKRPGTTASGPISGWRWTGRRTGCCRTCIGLCGLFGYFPTYTLGNVYAGCLHQGAAGGGAGPGRISWREGETAAATGWLRERLQRHGGLYEPREVVAQACGFEPSEGPLLDYLEAKFRDLYRL